MEGVPGPDRSYALVDATAVARRRAQDLRERSHVEPARLLEEAAEWAGEIAHHLAGIVERLADEATAGRPIDAQVHAFRAAARTAIAAAAPREAAATSVLPLRPAASARVRVLSGVLTAFDLADAGRSRSEVAEYLRTRGYEAGVLDVIVAVAFDGDVSG